MNTALDDYVTDTDQTTALSDYVTTATLTTDYSTTTDMNSAISSATTDLVSTSTLGDYATTAAVQQNFYTKADGEDLEAQYTVKVDLNGAVAGFGLASSTTAAGNIVSEFIVNADRFALLGTATDTGNPSVPFSVVTSQQTINGETVPAGVYIADGFIKNGTITNAKIGDAAIDNAKIASLSADKITAGTIDTNRLNIDSTTLTSNPNTGALEVGAIEANQITSGSISATVMQGTNVYAGNLLGDVSIMRSFRDTTLQSFSGGANTGTYGGTLIFLEEDLPATSHTTVGHIPYAQCSGWFNSTNSKTYSIRMWMKDNSTASTTLGSPASVGSSSGGKGSPTLYYMTFSGDKRFDAPQGSVLSNGSSSGTVTSALYNSSSNVTTLYHTTAFFSTSNTITVAASNTYQLVGETRFKASTSLYMPFSISGTLGRRTTGTVDLKLDMTRYGSSGVGSGDTGSTTDQIGEVNGLIIGMR